MKSSPQLSVILVIYRDFDEVRITLDRLRAQTIVDQIELVIVAPHAVASTVERDLLTPFVDVQIVAVDRVDFVSQGFVAGFNAANAPFVVIAEDHGLVEADWAELLVNAHLSGDYAVVAPNMLLGNPKTAAARTNFLMSFGQWYKPLKSGEISGGPGHNSCYRKATILKHFSDLDAMFSMENMFHVELTRRGERIYVEKRARNLHWVLASFQAVTLHSFVSMRVYGALRVKLESWGLGKRIVYALAAPLIPLVRLRYILGNLETPEKRRAMKIYRTMPMLVWSLYFAAIGEAVGYVFGMGKVLDAVAPYELERRDYVSPEERAPLQRRTAASKQSPLSTS